MVGTSLSVSSKIGDMTRKKATGGKHATERISVAFPEKWHALARKLASKRQQPVLYTLIALLLKEAAEQGVTDAPIPPWEEKKGQKDGG
jgi:hypothetical protein